MIRKVFQTVVLLALSNFFMNMAWYGHLKFKEKPLLVVILASWGIALLEYCLQVPANRIGNEVLTVTQLKVIQEVLSLATFGLFAIFMFREKFNYNHAISFVLLIGAVYFATKK
ncbi:MAG: DMT family protein [Fimbriimonadaceae bacterium]|nr:MAG: DMT family protein [Fimbriimonadaceae bacterium]